MSDMDGESGGGGGLIAVLAGAAMALCCGILLLGAGGVLSGLGAWFLEGGWAWVAAVPLFAALGLHVWRRSEARRPPQRGGSAGTARRVR